MENEKNEPTMEETQNVKSDQILLDESLKVVRKYMYWSMGAGLIPVPYLDVVAVSGIQLKMLDEISKIYDVKFSENIGKSVVGALIGGITAKTISRSYVTSWIKSIPFIGVLGAVSMPLFSGASTWAVGRIFIQHFASGGTFLDFDPQKVKDYFKELYEEGLSMTKNMKTATE
jgi:uncharacterized protein (DUF697 family)